MASAYIGLWIVNAPPPLKPRRGTTAERIRTRLDKWER